jgi:transposase
MTMGKRKRERQEDLFIAVGSLPRSPGHPFYRRLNALLAEAGFDRWIESRCERYYEQEERRGQPSIPPGVYFRMLLVGYFEGIDSQRGIAWRCADSLSLRDFLGVPVDDRTPDHSTLTYTRQRLPAEVFEEVFQFVLGIAQARQLVSGKQVAVDSTTLEANAAMKSIVRRDTEEDWKTYVTRLMREEGVLEAEEQPSDEEVRRFDKGRKDKQVGNAEWTSPSDPDSRIARMKDGTTHLAYKAEHVIDLQSDLIVAAEIRPADHGDTQTLVDSLMVAQANLQHIKSENQIEEVVADKGYHAADTLELCAFFGLRTYIPEPTRKQRWRWTDRSVDHQRAVHLNRRRMQHAKGKRLQRQRSEQCERSFAHVCNSGGMRRTWLRGLADVSKRYLVATSAHNLSRILRTLFGTGKPRALQGRSGLLGLAQSAISRRLRSDRIAIAYLQHHPATRRPWLRPSVDFASAV